MLRNPARFLLSLDPRAALLGIVLTMGVLGGVSWAAMTALDYVDTLRRAERDALRAATMLDRHARAVIDPRLESLGRVVDRLRGRDRHSFVEAALGEALAAPDGALAVVDRDGRTVFGPSVALSDGVPALLRAIAATGGGTGVLAATGRFDGVDALVLGERVAGPDGRGWGAVLVAVPLSSLSAVLNAADGAVDARGQRSTGLYRLDGALLAGRGAAALGALPGVEAGTGQVAGNWPLQDRAHVLGWRRLAGLPVLAAVATPRDAILAAWRSRLERGVVVAGASLLALFGLGILGWESLKRERNARRALADANARLEQRVEERTADLRTLNQKLVAALAEKERANQAKARFLSAANHDLRQPFQALRLFHHLLSERLNEPRAVTIAEKMGEALESGEKLLHALLEVATLDAGVVKPKITAVPVAQVLEPVVGEFRDAAAAKGLTVRVRPCGVVVRTDPVLLTRMLRDLVGNAVAYTGSGGILIACRARGQWLRIEVWDTGPGIAPEHLDAIFEDFVQLGNPERDRARGLGLGLAKVRRKAALLGHTVDVRSRPGHGSVFAITVPVAAAEPAADTAAGSPGAEAKAGAPRVILVVEDDPVQRQGMQLLLETWGHTVTAAADGVAALERLRTATRPPDVIVTDFRLPGPLTGVQVVTRACELTGRPVPGIILTGDTAPERIREAVATGCRLLHKPFTPELLRDALAALGHGEAAPARAAQQTAA
ncbi:MAG TPA: hybrid sensor histidine kinase/response regulator [Azospirillum sp.]|nr:hybrid sensor histidine kinase/response regulator [Azospirillum sp.]